MEMNKMRESVENNFSLQIYLRQPNYTSKKWHEKDKLSSERIWESALAHTHIQPNPPTFQPTFQLSAPDCGDPPPPPPKSI